MVKSQFQITFFHLKNDNSIKVFIFWNLASNRHIVFELVISSKLPFIRSEKTFKDFLRKVLNYICYKVIMLDSALQYDSPFENNKILDRKYSNFYFKNFNLGKVIRMLLTSIASLRFLL